MSLFNTAYDKASVTTALKLLTDEPDYSGEFFEYGKYTKQLYDLIKNSLPDRPFAICLAGEWGEGKTSLLKRVYNMLEQEEEKGSDVKVIWFDAWQFEKLDPVKALIQLVLEKKLENENAKDKLKQVLRGMLFLTSDVVTETTIGKKMDEILEYFGLTVNYIQAFSEALDQAIGNGKLVIFVDDLDRCSIDNVIEMLEAIKLLFNANRAKFVVGVDITKLERAWVLKHKGHIDALNEGKEHLDKIFQLKLALPPKDDAMIRQYIKSITENLPEEIEKFLARSIPYNPRKIKRALNLTYFILRGIEDKKFSEQFPYVLVWAIVVTAFPEIAKHVKRDPQILIYLCAVTKSNDHSQFRRQIMDYMGTDTGKGGRRYNLYDKMHIAHASHPRAEELIVSDVIENPVLYRFLLNAKDALGINDDPTKSTDKTELLRRAINYAGLIS